MGPPTLPIRLSDIYNIQMLHVCEKTNKKKIHKGWRNSAYFNISSIGIHLLCPQLNTSSSASPFIFSFRVKLPWIFFSSASMVSPPMSASKWVRFTMPMPNTMSVTCCGSELTRLLRRPPIPKGLLGVAGSCCSFSNITLHGGSEGRWAPSGETKEMRSL